MPKGNPRQGHVAIAAPMRETNDAQLFAQSAHAPDQTVSRPRLLHCPNDLTAPAAAMMPVFHEVSRAERPSQQYPQIPIPCVPMNPTAMAQPNLPAAGAWTNADFDALNAAQGGGGHSAASWPRKREDPAQPLRKVFVNHPAAPGETDPVPAQRWNASRASRAVW